MKTVYIGGNKWSVTHSKFLKVNRRDVWGSTDSRRKEICIRSGMGQDVDQTLFHELIHSICREYSSSGDKTSAVLGVFADNELAVDILAKEMCGALRQLGMVK